MAEERVCARFRCPYYKKNNVNNIGVTNCGGTGWTNSCMLSCTFEKPNGDYTEEGNP